MTPNGIEITHDLVIDIGGVHPLGPLSIEDGFQRGIGNSGDERRRSGNDAGLFRSNRLLPLPFTIGVVATDIGNDSDIGLAHIRGVVAAE